MTTSSSSSSDGSLWVSMAPIRSTVGLKTPQRSRNSSSLPRWRLMLWLSLWTKSPTWSQSGAAGRGGGSSGVCTPSPGQRRKPGKWWPAPRWPRSPPSPWWLRLPRRLGAAAWRKSPVGVVWLSELIYERLLACGGREREKVIGFESLGFLLRVNPDRASEDVKAAGAAFKTNTQSWTLRRNDSKNIRTNLIWTGVNLGLIQVQTPISQNLSLPGGGSHSFQ